MKKKNYDYIDRVPFDMIGRKLYKYFINLFLEFLFQCCVLVILLSEIR